MNRRVRSESTFEFRAPDREEALAALQTALDAACRNHPEVSSHDVVINDGELEISFELDLGATGDPQQIVLELVDSAVAAMGGRISTEHERTVSPEPVAVLEKLGTYLVPA